MNAKKTNTISKVVEWTDKIRKQADLIANHPSHVLLIKTLHNAVHGTLNDDGSYTSKMLFQSLVLSYIKDNYTIKYNAAIIL